MDHHHHHHPHPHPMRMVICDTFWCDPLECPFPQASGTSLAQHLWLFFGGAQDGIAQQKHLLNLQGIHAPCWDGDSGAIVLTCPICPASVDSHATVLRGPRWAGVGAACPAMPSMAQQLEGGGWFWFLDYGAGTKGHQGAPEVPNSPSHAILVTSEKLQAEARHAKKIKKQQKQRTYNLLMKIKKT